MSDSSAIDAALAAKLGSDPQLLALMPNGVYFDEAPPYATRFVLVSVVIGMDEPTYEGRAWEDVLYLVKAVGRTTAMAPGDVRAAAARIDALLEDGTLEADGYGLMDMHRVERVLYTEVDDGDAKIRWQHGGGRYRVRMALVEPTSRNRS